MRVLAARGGGSCTGSGRRAVASSYLFHELNVLGFQDRGKVFVGDNDLLGEGCGSI